MECLGRHVPRDRWSRSGRPVDRQSPRALAGSRPRCPVAGLGQQPQGGLRRVAGGGRRESPREASRGQALERFAAGGRGAGSVCRRASPPGARGRPAKKSPGPLSGHRRRAARRPKTQRGVLGLAIAILDQAAGPPSATAASERPSRGVHWVVISSIVPRLPGGQCGVDLFHSPRPQAGRGSARKSRGRPPCDRRPRGPGRSVRPRRSPRGRASPGHKDLGPPEADLPHQMGFEVL